MVIVLYGKGTDDVRFAVLPFNLKRCDSLYPQPAGGAAPRLMALPCQRR
jgi:hypothetical protein